MNAAKRQNIFSLRKAQRTWAMAAIHGEVDRLARLHDRIAERFRDGDRIIYLGNYLGRGEAINATVEELLDFRRRILARPRGFACDIVYLRGAQEEMWHKLLELQFAPNPGAVLTWMVREGIEPTIRAYGGDLRQGFAATRDGPRTITRWTSALRAAMNAAPGHTTLFTSLRHAAVTEDRRVLFVHAGVDARQKLETQRDAFWWGDSDILTLTAPFDGFRRVVRGFDRERRGVVETEFGVSLDAGAGRGGRLLAAAFDPDGAVVDRLEI
ncbi:MAG: hypothetical protein JO001_09585 [Alphaproteobacteria bacterium]|nr:hypothetical protein [Alphaproteobacteria bacterium]